MKLILFAIPGTYPCLPSSSIGNNDKRKSWYLIGGNPRIDQIQASGPSYYLHFPREAQVGRKNQNFSLQRSLSQPIITKLL